MASFLSLLTGSFSTPAGENPTGAMVEAAYRHLDVDTLRPGMAVADVIPNPPRTHLIRDAESRGCTVLDGLGMLVNQGVIGIRHWTGVDPVVMRRTLEAL